MKLLLTSLILSISINAFSQSKEAAATLWKNRGADINNALKAAEMFETLAETEADTMEKTLLLNNASLAFYTYGENIDSKGEKKNVHIKGMNAATRAINALLGTETEDGKEMLALSYFRKGSNLGKWGEANGIPSSLAKWPELKGYMNKIINAGFASLEYYGANRILGRANYKLPAPLGSKKDAEKYLKEAFDNTTNGYSVSVYGLNNLFYADLLISQGKKEEAKKILSDFIALDPETLLPGRVFETKKEMEEAKETLANL